MRYPCLKLVGLTVRCKRCQTNRDTHLDTKKVAEHETKGAWYLRCHVCRRTTSHEILEVPTRAVIGRPCRSGRKP